MSEALKGASIRNQRRDNPMRDQRVESLESGGVSTESESRLATEGFVPMIYPAIDKAGAGNPLYATSSQDIGCMPPSSHHVPDRRFPKRNEFSQSFANRTVQFAGLNTNNSRSKVHSSLDLYY